MVILYAPIFILRKTDCKNLKILESVKYASNSLFYSQSIDKMGYFQVKKSFFLEIATKNIYIKCCFFK